RRSGNGQSARKTPGPPPTARVPGGRPWSSMLQNSSRQLCGSPPQPSFILLSLPRLGFHNPSLRHTGVIYVSLMDLAGRNVQFISRPRALTYPDRFYPKTGMRAVIPTRPFGAPRRHRVPPRAGEVHVASFAESRAAVRLPWSVSLWWWRSVMNLQRRRFLRLAAGAAALPALPPRAWALDYPTRPVRIVVPYPAGIAPDIVARVVAQPLSQRLKQQF